MELTDLQFQLIVKVVHEDRIKMLRAKLESDTKGPAVTRGESTFVTRPLTVAHL